VTYSDHLAFDEAAVQVRQWRRPLLISHTKPDGDAIGSLVATRRVLRGHGLQPVTVVFDPVPDRYRFLVDDDPLTRVSEDDVAADLDSLELDGVIVLDTCTYNQLEPVGEWLRASSLPKLAVDHHITRDALANLYLVDETAAATSLLLFEWFCSCGWTVDALTAQALFVGVATDTGWFHHSNTDARAMVAATRLVEHGVRPSAMFDHLFQQESAARFRLRAAIVSSLELHAGDRLAVQTVPASVFEDTGATLADTEDLVNEPLRIGSVVLSVMLVEHGGGVTRVGFRSRAPMNEESLDIDVASVARSFGGGGHRRAAGARIQAPLDHARQQVVAALTATLA
jgi:phosphoesterase RecJ-like protein